jgi:uncharacterized protein (TIGR00299 family) protein
MGHDHEHGHHHDHGHGHHHAHHDHDHPAGAAPARDLPVERGLVYLDCIGGTAGDMLLAALLDAGAPLAAVEAAVGSLVDGIRIEVGWTARHAIGARTVRVVGPDEGHVHRTWRDVRELLDRADLAPRARARAHRAFELLAHAEGRVHGVDPDAVHFHEVGAIDAIGDVVGVCAALEALGADRVEASPLPLGRGLTSAAHGRIPLPAPAVLEILQGAPVAPSPAVGETVTPTGAALVAAVADAWGGVPALRLGATGYGAGGRDEPDVPNLVRALVGVPLGAGGAPISVVEATIDDLNPELIPDALDDARAAGALAVWTAPVVMKHGRHGTTITAIARPADRDAVATALLRSTSTLGVRITDARRLELDRDEVTVAVRGHDVRVKRGLLDGAVVNVAPEHRDCAAAARALDVPVKEVWASALAAAHGTER